jgi:hypothetical protein
MVMTARRPRMNSRAEKSTLRGGAGKGGGGLFRIAGELSMIGERERERNYCVNGRGG